MVCSYLFKRIACGTSISSEQWVIVSGYEMVTINRGESSWTDGWGTMIEWWHR